MHVLFSLLFKVHLKLSGCMTCFGAKINIRSRDCIIFMNEFITETYTIKVNLTSQAL